MKVIPIFTCCFALLTASACLAIQVTEAQTSLLSKAVANRAVPISVDQLGAVVGRQYQGDGMSVTPTPNGARLSCVFQKLEGIATPEGLWLTSTATNLSDCFRAVAVEVGRQTAQATAESRPPASRIQLADAGKVSIEGQTVRCVRPGLVEEYSVSVDGVRQDFIVTKRPAGVGELIVNLSVTGAKVGKTAYGARLTLENSGRNIAYSGLRATDATGKSLLARMAIELSGDEGNSLQPESDYDNSVEGMNFFTPVAAEARLTVVVNDAGAVYPVRIDPTFSDANWLSMGGVPGVDATVYAAVVDGAGNLYIGGDFTIAGNTLANKIARWNGSEWSALGAGMNDSVNALVFWSGRLYAGGNFTTAGGNPASYIAQWDGSSWSAVGSGMTGSSPIVWALAAGGVLYAGGNFSMAGGNPAQSLAQWDGVHWSPVGNATISTVYALALSINKLYAAGVGITLGTNLSDIVGVAQYQGTNWSRLGEGNLFGTPLALAVSGTSLYVGGEFTRYSQGPDPSNDIVLNYIAQWDGSKWSALGSGMDDRVQSLAVSGSSTLYAGGQFSAAGGNPANHIAQWSSGGWSAVGSGIDGNVQSLAVSGGTLYAGGGFAMAGTNSAFSIAQWNGNDWSALGSGINGSVEALTVLGGALYAGGTFTKVGTNVFNHIAQWQGSGWSALGSGVNNDVLSLTVSGGTLYAGGAFTMAGTNMVNHIAQWNGSSWSALGLGMNGNVLGLATASGMLYAGGTFTTIGTNTVNHIAQWNGSDWSPLESGMNGPVEAVALSGGTLYAGGAFTMASTNMANYIAQWNGTNWSALGAGMNSNVLALAVANAMLYAGGTFTTAGTNAANHIAQWNGSGWSALGSGLGAANNYVSALAALNGTLYAGGYFRTAGGNPANYIAQWNGSSWSALGSGMGGIDFYPYVYPAVNALAGSGNILYAGGWFTTAGTNVSLAVAEAILNGAPVTLAIITDKATFGLTNGIFGFEVSGPAGSNVVIQASTNLLTWTPLKTNLLNNGLLYFSDPQPATNRQRLYRAVLLP